MNIKALCLFLLIACMATPAFSQQADSARVRLNHYTFTYGMGWSHYIDNLEYGNEDLKQDFGGFSFKFFWEPEYRVSLGLETGYYRLFESDYKIGPDTTVTISRVAIPMLLLVRMRIIDNVYLGAGTGLAILTNRTAGAGQDIETKTTSLSNFQLSGSYIYPLGPMFRIGGEFKAFHFANLNDWMYSVQVLFTFRL